MSTKIGITCGDYTRRGIGRYNQELSQWIVNTGLSGKDTFVELPSRPPEELLIGLTGVHFTSQFHLPEMTVPYVVTVHDVIPVIFYEEFERKAKQKYPQFSFHDRVASDLARIASAAHVIVPSQCTKTDLMKVTGIPDGKITVVPMGIHERFFAGDAFRPKGAYCSNEPSLLYIGALDDRKNLRLALDVVILLVAQGVNPHLRVAGHFCPEGRLLFEKLIADKGLTGYVTLQSDASDAELLSAMHAADVFLFPSIYEGFGMPPVEAMLCGTPVVSSNASCMPEVLGAGNALFFAPDDPMHAAKLVMESVSDYKATADRVSRAFKHASQYTWERTLTETFGIYQEYLGAANGLSDLLAA
jgi:glycosyltransferase involved in cell wall biosynthesis